MPSPQQKHLGRGVLALSLPFLPAKRQAYSGGGGLVTVVEVVVPLEEEISQRAASVSEPAAPYPPGSWLLPESLNEGEEVGVE